MAVPTIKLHQEKPSKAYECDMCRDVSRKNKFTCESYYTKEQIFICRECAYRERYGTKKIKQAKKERLLEQEKTKQ